VAARAEAAIDLESWAVFVAGFPSLVTATNCWVIAPGAGEQCVVVDPGIGIVDELDELIEQFRLHPVAVLLTHGHLDHTFSVLPVCQARDVPAYIHPGDRSQIADPWTYSGLPKGAPILGMQNLTFAEPDDIRELADGQPISLADMEFSVMHAPGHTVGSMMFGLSNAELTRHGHKGDDDALLFSGDVLFAGSIGRVDLPGGSMEAMVDSLTRVVLPLDDAMTVHPGHGPSTTIGHERLTNPYLRGLQ
jgi:hydroxyacylglutathione hydrolase